MASTLRGFRCELCRDPFVAASPEFAIEEPSMTEKLIIQAMLATSIAVRAAVAIPMAATLFDMLNLAMFFVFWSVCRRRPHGHLGLAVGHRNWTNVRNAGVQNSTGVSWF